MDANLSYDPADVPTLLAAIKTGCADMVQGSRYAPDGGVEGGNGNRRMLSRAANLMYDRGAGTPDECTTNFRVSPGGLRRIEGGSLPYGLGRWNGLSTISLPRRNISTWVIQ